MKDVTIRSAEPGDLTELLEMVVALTRHHADVARVTAQSLKRDVFGPVPWYHVLVAVQGAGLVGYAAALPLGRLGYGARGLDLHHLFVQPAARRLGVGRNLVRAVEDMARKMGGSYVIIGTHPDNLAAQSYYPQLGYLPHENTARRFTKTLD